MAKLCSSYGSPPNFMFFSEDLYNTDMEPLHNDLSCLSNDLGLINPDPAELFEDVNLLNVWPTSSICSDIQKIKADSPTNGGGYLDNGTFHDVKPEIRNVDCMWSASTAQLSTSASSSLSDSVTSANAVPLAAITGTNTQNVAANSAENTQSQSSKQVPPPKIVVANNRSQQQAATSGNTQQQQFETLCVKREIKEEPLDDYEQQLQQHSIPNSSRVGNPNRPKVATLAASMQHIPPGTSLLRKSQLQQQQQQQSQLQQQSGKKYKQQVPKMYAGEFVRERDQLLTTTAALSSSCKGGKLSAASKAYLRPDTPHSLDDELGISKSKNHSGHDEEVFKHNVDLHACVMGSNNISLTADPTHFIQHVSQELQDTSKTQIDMRLVPTGGTSLADVTEVLEIMTGMNVDCGGTTTSNSSGVDCDSDSAEEEEWDAVDSTRCSMDSMLEHTESADISAYGNASSASPVPSHDSLMSGSSSSNNYEQQPPYAMHSDHSYTRCKDGIDDLGPSLETPSDSDEEIDVVSIGDKKLPTNPSDKDRRALQTKVAYKFSNARIVKTANGVRTIPPIRRVSYDLPYTPASTSPVKSVANSRYPSPTSTPAHLTQQQYTSRYVQQQQNMLKMLSANGGADKNRKRLTHGASAVSELTGQECALPPSKKHRGKKSLPNICSSSSSKSLSASSTASLLSPPAACSGATPPYKRSFSNLATDEAADTIEKRNLHNDMERQRRIGLKNLFEALKKQIPSIKDKERAPKVNILREAAKLCESLTREDQQLSEQKALLKEQTRKFQEELARLRALMPATMHARD